MNTSNQTINSTGEAIASSTIDPTTVDFQSATTAGSPIDQKEVSRLENELRIELETLTKTGNSRAAVIKHQSKSPDWNPHQISIPTDLRTTVRDSRGRLPQGLCQALTGVTKSLLGDDIFAMFKLFPSRDPENPGSNLIISFSLRRQTGSAAEAPPPAPKLTPNETPAFNQHQLLGPLASQQMQLGAPQSQLGAFPVPQLRPLASQPIQLGAPQSQISAFPVPQLGALLMPQQLHGQLAFNPMQFGAPQSQLGAFPVPQQFGAFPVPQQFGAPFGAPPVPQLGAPQSQSPYDAHQHFGAPPAHHSQSLFAAPPTPQSLFGAPQNHLMN